MHRGSLKSYLLLVLLMLISSGYTECYKQVGRGDALPKHIKTLAIPAFQKVRVASQDKAVLNNARQMAAAADQYYLENGATFAVASNLIGATNYVKALNTVASESYPAGYTQGVTITIAGVANARTITFSP